MLVRITGSNVLLAYVTIVGMSVLFSAVIDNIPFLVAMLPVMKIMTEQAGVSPYLFYFGLLIGASVGGNITPIGAAANIVAMGIMKKEGHAVRFSQFVRIGLPFTLVAVTASAAFVWFFYG
jgi:Na+/H+ antiporter NhaD/arsenite permease-like protein